MCGIYGFVAKNPTENEMFVYELLGIETEMRGRHATGFYSLNGRVIFDKAPLPASAYFNTSSFNQFYVSREFPNLIIGHNRWATHGDPSDNRNNHPFVNDRFGFIHNGVVGDKGIKTESECDSEQIFRYFVKQIDKSNNIIKAITKTRNFFSSGSLACALLDNKKRNIILFRNNRNPIFIFKLKNSNAIFFSSTEDIAKNVSNTISEEIVSGRNVKENEIVILSEEGKEKSHFIAQNKIQTIYSNKNLRFGIPQYYKPKHACIYCGKSFNNEETLNVHMNSMHKLVNFLEEDDFDITDKNRLLVVSDDELECPMVCERETTNV